MGIKQLYNYNVRKLPNEYGDVSVMYTFLMILYMYIAWGKGRKLLGDKLLMSTESPYLFDHLLQVSNKSL